MSLSQQLGNFTIVQWPWHFIHYVHAQLVFRFCVGVSCTRTRYSFLNRRYKVIGLSLKRRNSFYICIHPSAKGLFIFINWNWLFGGISTVNTLYDLCQFQCKFSCYSFLISSKNKTLEYKVEENNTLQIINFIDEVIDKDVSKALWTECLVL